MVATLSWFDEPAREAALLNEARRADRQIQAFSSQANPAVARNASRIAEAYPTLDREVITAASLAGVPADNPMLNDLAMRSWESDQNLWDVAYGAVKGTARIAGTIAQSAYEEIVSRPLRTVVGTLQGMDLAEAYEQAGSSVGVRALQELAAGRPVNLGSGFLPGSDVATPTDPNVRRLVAGGVPEAQAITEVQANYGAPIWDQYIADSERIKFRGMPVSPGRLAAGVFALEPGSLPYNIFSGSIDAVSQVVLDPTSKLFAGFKIPKFIPGIGGAKVIPGINDWRRSTKALAGISPEGGLRNTVFSPRLNEFLDDLEGQLLLDALWEHKDDPITLGAIFSRGGAANPPSRLINEITKATSRTELTDVMRGGTGRTVSLADVIGGGPSEVLASLRTQGATIGTRTGADVADVLGALPQSPVAGRLSGAIGESIGPALGRATSRFGGPDITPELGRVLGAKATVARSIDGTRLGRLFATMPGSQIDFSNLDESATTLDNWMLEAKFDLTERSRIMAKWHQLNDVDRVNADFYELVMSDVAETFASKVVVDVVPPSVMAQGDEAVKVWRAKSGPGNVDDIQFFEMMSQNVRNWFDDLDEARRYFTADLMNAPFPGSRYKVLGSGGIIEQPTAQLLAEYLNRGVALPDARQVRRAVSSISKAVANDALELRAAPKLFDIYMQKIWKPMVLLRVAFPIRVVADEQLRMAVAGLDSVFRHPIDFLSWAIADPTQDGAIAKILRGTSQVIPEIGDNGAIGIGRSARGANRIIARELGDEAGEIIERFEPIAAARQARAAQTHGGGHLLGYQPQLENAGEVAYKMLANTPAGQNAPKGFVTAWATEWLQLAGDEVAPRVARAGSTSLDEAKDWFWANPEIRNALADTDLKKVLVDDGAAQAQGYRNARDAADVYIDGIWARINEKSGGKISWNRDATTGRVSYSIDQPGNTDLIRGLGEGRIASLDGRELELSTLGQKRYKALVDTFADKYYDEWAPDGVKVHDHTRTWRNVQSTPDRMVARLFDVLASTPTNVLSRSPAFRQFYWQRVEQLMGHVDDAGRDQLLRAAQAANLDRPTLQRFARNALESTVPVAERLELDDIDNIALAFGLDQTRDLLYDLHKRSNFMDIARNIFPFGEAWVEILTRWSSLLYDNPETLRRFQQLVEGGRRSGFITTDEVTGKEVFNYPGGGLLANWMLSGANPAAPGVGLAGGAALGGAVGGIPGGIIGGIGGAAAGALVGGAAAGDQGDASIALQGQVQGLNLVAASYLPGLGPVVQAPLAALMSSGWVMSRPNLDWTREQMFPFGDPQINSLNDLLELGLPAWSQKILQPLSTGDPDFARLHAHSTIDVMRALLQTPGYSKDTPDEMLRLQRDAADIARNLSVIRGFLQFGLPTGPQVRYYAAAESEDPETNGTFYLFQTLASDYRSMLEAHNFDDVAATDEFVATYGLNPVDFITSKTTAAIRRGATTDAFNFERTHSEQFDRFPLTAYYGEPDDPDADFDLRAWSRQLDSGTREGYTPAQWLSARNHTLGAAAYEEAKRKVQAKRAERGETDLENYNENERAFLRDTKMWLMDRYEGYNRPNVGTPTKGSVEQQIAELVGWGSDPVLASTSAGRGLAVYLEARAEVMDAAERAGFSPTAFQSGKLSGRGINYRRYLRETAEWIISQPEMRDFGPLWLAVLSRELKDDVDPETGIAA